MYGPFYSKIPCLVQIIKIIVGTTKSIENQFVMNVRMTTVSKSSVKKTASSVTITPKGFLI